MTDLDAGGPSWRAGDVVWRRQGGFLQRKRISQVDRRGVFVDGRLVPADRLLPAEMVDVPESVAGLALDGQIYDYRVWRAYESARLSDLGRKGKVAGLYVENLGCDGARARYFAGRGQDRADSLSLLAELERSAHQIEQAEADGRGQADGS